MGLQIRRGLEVTRTGFVPAIGELIVTTDEKKLYIGDGTTAGGVLVTGSGGGGGNLDFGTFSAPAGFTLDLGTI